MIRNTRGLILALRGISDGIQAGRLQNPPDRGGGLPNRGHASLGSHAGSHVGGQPPGNPDEHEQRVGTRPRSRTDLNGCGCPHMELRVSPCTAGAAPYRRVNATSAPAASVAPIYGSGAGRGDGAVDAAGAGAHEKDGADQAGGRVGPVILPALFPVWRRWVDHDREHCIAIRQSAAQRRNHGRWPGGSSGERRYSERGPLARPGG